jgi:predicted type IV restriction endonuclease
MDIKTIQSIITSLKQREFVNEAEVTQGVILRILNQLNWDVYDTKKVKPQFRIDNRMIDFALCSPDNKPSIIIEVKALGKANNSDDQVLEYAFKTGIPIAILTDGQEWHFYLPAERGSLSERRFYKLDLVERNENEIIEIFHCYLDYNAVRSGDALKKARIDYEKQYKNKEINSSIPIAWNKLIEENDDILVSLISEKVADICGYEPPVEVVISFLKSLGQQSSSSPIDRPIVEKKQPQGLELTHISQGVYVNDNIFEKTRNSIGTLESLLKPAIVKYPRSLNKIENQTKGRSRSLISKSKNSLYENRADLINEYSKQLPNGWWFGTNYGRKEITKFCMAIENSINGEYGNQNIKWKL